MNKKFVIIVALLYLSFPLLTFCETVILKSGKTIEGKILEQTDKNVKVDIEGIPVTYYIEEIESVNGVKPVKEIGEGHSPQATSIKITPSSIDLEHVRKQLKRLGYPEHAWSNIEKELTAFLAKIDFSQLKEEAERVKSNPSQLKDFVSKLSKLFMQEGCFNIKSPHPLVKLLITSLAENNIFQVIDTSPISPEEKNKSKELLVSCSAVSQLGFIVLDLLGIETSTASSPGHIFNCIFLDNKQIIFVDFFNQIFETVDINLYYQPEGKCQALKEEYRLTPERMSEIFEQWIRGLRPDSLQEVLGFLYSYVFIDNGCGATYAIYDNFGAMYSAKGNYDQAIYNYNKAIELNSNAGTSYYNRGNAYIHKGSYDQAISDYSKAIERNPNDSEAYAGKGNGYYFKGEYNLAITNFNKAIALNPNLPEAYNNRAMAYFYSRKDYDKSWDDIYMAEALGYKVDQNFLDELKKASGRGK